MDNKQLLINGGVLVVGAGVGFGAGYLVFKKKFEKISEQEIESVRQAYAKNAQPKPDLEKLRRTNYVPPVTSEEAQEQAHILATYDSETPETDADAFRRAHGRVPTTSELISMGNGTPVEEAVIRNPNDTDDNNIVESNVFDNPELLEPDPEDIGEGEDEIPPRSAERPYVIEAAEWYTNQTNYDQISLTYWADDDVLADVNKRMITDIEGVVGATNLHRFGFQSNDPDIVYVRNDRLKADYEITKDERNYAEIVHGVDPDAERVSSAPRRMRSNDE
jgi:hypothetical protein